MNYPGGNPGPIYPPSQTSGLGASGLGETNSIVVSFPGLFWTLAAFGLGYYGGKKGWLDKWMK